MYLNWECIWTWKPGSTSVADETRAKSNVILTIDPFIFTLKALQLQKIHGLTWSKCLTSLESQEESYFHQIWFYSDNDELSSHIVKIRQNFSGESLKKNVEWIGWLLLAKLREKYCPIVTVIEHSGITLSGDVVKSKIETTGK